MLIIRRSPLIHSKMMEGYNCRLQLYSKIASNTPKIDNLPNEGLHAYLSEAFTIKKNMFLELHKYNPFRPINIKQWKEDAVRNYLIKHQRFIPERHAMLGSDLATAHFIIYRGGKVKFHDIDKWWVLDEEEEDCEGLPAHYVKNMYIECIDASNTVILYEGLVNFMNLNRLKWISFRNCPHVDDWFLDKISGEYGKTLEYLDISNCKITENGFNCLYRFQNLKTLVVHNIVKNSHFEFTCFQLEDAMPGLVIEGVKYLQNK